MAKTFPSAQRENLSEQIARDIGLSIMRSEFKPGEALLSEPELSVQMHVSRAVLREALKMLGKKGMLEARPKLGTRVRPRQDWNLLDSDIINWQYEVGPDRAYLEAICEVRLMFEPMTSRLAASRATEREIEQISGYCQRMESVLDSTEEYDSADQLFHEAICAAAHNILLQRITATLAASLHVSRLITSRVPGANLAAMPAHRAVSEAIRARDEQAAEEAMRQLVMLTTNDIHRALGM